MITGRHLPNADMGHGDRPRYSKPDRADAVVAPNTVVPDGQLVLGAVAVVRGPLTGSAQRWVDDNPRAHREPARRHRRGVALVN